ncbi:MAG: nuclear transport factor 2 family protein [Woeseiaceae bacterium]
MAAAENRKLIERFYALSNAGRIEEATELIDADIVWTNIGSTRFSGAFEGKQEVLEKLVGPLFGRLVDGIHCSIRNLIAEGDQVAAQIDGRARTRDGRDYNNSYCNIYRIRDGKIVRIDEYMDTALVDAVFGN